MTCSSLRPPKKCSVKSFVSPISFLPESTPRCRWGDGKSTLWNQIQCFLRSDFLREDADRLYSALRLGDGPGPGSGPKPLGEASKNARAPFENALERLLDDPHVSESVKSTWMEKNTLPERPSERLTMLEQLIVSFLILIYFCCAVDHDAREREALELSEYRKDHPQAERVCRASKSAHSRQDERVAAAFALFVLVPLAPVWIIIWPMYRIYSMLSSSNVSSCRVRPFSSLFLSPLNELCQFHNSEGRDGG